MTLDYFGFLKYAIAMDITQRQKPTFIFNVEENVPLTKKISKFIIHIGHVRLFR